MSSTTGILATTSNPGSYNAMNTLSGTAKTLDQNDFLKLLVTQIQYQDPMNPKSNTDMAAQMAQFTSLQQAAQSSSSLLMMQANSLIGSQVALLSSDGKSVTTGLVSGMKMENGKPQILVEGAYYSLSQIVTVSPTTTATTPTTSPGTN